MMQIRCLILLSLFLLLSRQATASTPSENDMLDRVRVLASDELAGRGNGTDGAARAADLIRDWLALAGAEPLTGADWFQDFPLAGEGFRGLTGRNVLGVIPGRGDLAGRHVVIGAHYDHLGLRLDDDGVTATGIYHGAEDNASGISVLIDLTNRLADAAGDQPRRTVLVAAFAGEEIGLLGSRWLTDHLPVPRESIDLMLNLDSVGRLRDRRLYVGGVGSAVGLRAHVQSVNRSHGLNLEMSEGGWDASDHVAFNTAGVPVLFLFTGPHPQYHSVDDTWDLIDPVALLSVAEFAWDLIDLLVTIPDRLVYLAVADLPDRDASTRGAERSWLGTIPDFVDGVAGVQLSGVMPGSPAEEAGLVKGDVVIGVGDVVVTSLSDLTVALRTYEVGRMIEVRFLRDGEPRVLPVTLRPRPR